MSTLKPCPFCGNDDFNITLHHFDSGQSKIAVECAFCTLRTDYFDNINEAVHSWNERADGSVLKPCPFCGGTASLVYFTLDDPFTSEDEIFCRAECSKCHATSNSGSDIYKIINLWNERSDI